MSVWSRIKKLFGGDADPASEADEAEGALASLPPASTSLHPGEDVLGMLTEPSVKVDPREIAQAVEALRKAGLELRAVELLGDAYRLRPEEEEIQAALAFLHVARLDFDAAAPILEDLCNCNSPRYSQRAEFLLGERAERGGEQEEALRHYERVLAKDVMHGQARARAERLRDQLGSRDGPSAQATMIQPEGVSAQSRYQLVRELGRGGAGAVYLALDTHLDREVALKVYHPQVMKADGPTQLAREAALPARVGHPGIVKVLDVDSELGAVVMEVLDGGSVKDVLRKETLTLERALSAIRALCGPLGALHDLGIVHRDVKPGNIMLRGGDLERPVLTDLGVALLPGETHEPGLGTPAFMSPEQRSETDLDARADVYSTGVMLAAMLGGYPGPRGPVGDFLDRCLCEEPGGRPRDAHDLRRQVDVLRETLFQDDGHRADMTEIAKLSDRIRAS